MRRRCPPVVIVVAVLNFVVGGLALLVGGYGVLFWVLLDQPTDSVPLSYFLREMGRQVPGWYSLELARSVLVAGLGIVFFTTVAGLLRMDEWARRWAIGCGLVAVPLHLGYLVWQVGWVTPAAARVANTPPRHDRLTDQERRYLSERARTYRPPPSQKPADQTAVALGMLGGAVLFSTHGLLVAFLLAARRVRGAFEAAWPRAPARPPRAYRPGLDESFDLPTQSGTPA